MCNNRVLGAINEKSHFLMYLVQARAKLDPYQQSVQQYVKPGVILVFDLSFLL